MLWIRGQLQIFALFSHHVAHSWHSPFNRLRNEPTHPFWYPLHSIHRPIQPLMHSSCRSRECVDKCLDVDVCASLGSVVRNVKFSISLHSLIHGRRALSFLKDEFILLKRSWSDEFQTPDLRVVHQKHLSR